MSDSISSIPRVPPTYPVKPAQPAAKDRETGGREKRKEDRPNDDEPEREQKTTIDEHV